MVNDFINDNRISYLSEIRRVNISIYWLVMLITIISISLLPVIKFDISVKSQGIVRPKDEKTELRSSVTSIIDSIYFKEGDTVRKGDIVIQLRKENIGIKKSMNNFEISQRDQFINDLRTLTQRGIFNNSIINTLQSPVYKQQTSRFILQLSELHAQLKKVKKELYMDSILSIDRTLAPKEMFDKEIEYEKLIANIKALQEQQLASWQSEFVRYQLEKNQFQSANSQLTLDADFYAIRAPINGIIQNFNKYYKGSIVQSGEILGIISPESDIVAECYINTRDIGLIKPNQQATFQIDAFDYNYFGILTGKILSIDNDYTIVDNKPVFKIRCLLDARQLHLKNGFSGVLKKGMTLQARFIVARRSFWQLLFDKIDDWINPSAPTKTA